MMPKVVPRGVSSGGNEDYTFSDYAENHPLPGSDPHFGTHLFLMDGSRS